MLTSCCGEGGVIGLTFLLFPNREIGPVRVAAVAAVVCKLWAICGMLGEFLAHNAVFFGLRRWDGILYEQKIHEKHH